MAKQIPARVRKNYPDVPWKEIAGLRDIIVHEYFGVTLEMIWKTITEDIPVLQSQLRQIIHEINGN